VERLCKTAGRSRSKQPGLAMIPEVSILDRSWIVLVSIARIDTGSIQDRSLANKSLSTYKGSTVYYCRTIKGKTLSILSLQRKYLESHSSSNALSTPSSQWSLALFAPYPRSPYDELQKRLSLAHRSLVELRVCQ
jgi:hypothetical protein